MRMDDILRFRRKKICVLKDDEFRGGNARQL